MKPYIQPFERALALEELSSLSSATPSLIKSADDQENLYAVKTLAHAKNLADSLAYWEVVGRDNPLLTRQVLRERTVNVVRNGVNPAMIPELLLKQGFDALPNRRCLRYGTHGIHEYRGKFFPQLVRSLLNIAKVPAKGIVVDPMMGSGTTAVEAVLCGYKAVGVDMNPLSVLMAETKCDLLGVQPKTLEIAYIEIRDRLLMPMARRSRDTAYLDALAVKDQEYLRQWFSEQVLSDLDLVAQAIQSVASTPIRNFMRLALSNILRGVSWQKDDDLRVRKDVRPDEEIDPIRAFLEELGRSVRLVLAFLYENAAYKLGTHDVKEGDARSLSLNLKKWKGRVDVVITSPPYATALPYLDTDRLSLCYLNLLPRPEHRSKDQMMIGNREVTERLRREYWSTFVEKRNELPSAISELIEKVGTLNSTIEVGFRRKNLPALLAKYFFDMRDVLLGIKEILKDGAPAYIVVGSNHTIAGGVHVDIDTCSLLKDLAVSVGLKFESRMSMEMLVSRDIFKNNTGSSEEILCVRKTA
jgi:DNA modification methylase